MRRRFAVPVLAAMLGAIALPVHGYFQAYSFFNPSDKYRQWFHDTVWLQDTVAQATRRGIRQVSDVRSTAEKYPYPDKELVMTERLWLKSANNAIFGDPDWYDVEVVRQRAEVEEYAPAMDLLAWMYQEGRGLPQDLRKAYNMYEMAKLAGHEKLSGNSAKIFSRLTPPEKVVAELQLIEDIKRMKPELAPDEAELKSVRLHVMKQQRELDSLDLKRKHGKSQLTAADSLSQTLLTAGAGGEAAN